MWINSIPRLSGDIVILEPLSRAHADALYEAAKPLEIWEWWPFNPARSREDFDRWIETSIGAAAEGSEVRFATLDALTGEAIGGTSFCTLRPEHLGLEIGWTWLTPSRWGTGANVEAKLLQLSYAFEVLGCQRVEFATDEQNRRARHALASLPAQFEGVLRDLELLPDGRRLSWASYSILDREWSRVKDNLRGRLSRAAG